MYRVGKVLVPVDFSTFSRAAFAFARAIGDEPPRVHLTHVLEPWRPYVRSVLFPYAALGEDDVEFEHELVEEARLQLAHHLECDPADDDQIAGFSFDFGPLGQTLAQQTRSIGPDLVVMGAFGDTGVRPNALGSTARELVQMTSCPTMLVRDYEPEPSIEHIVVAVDLSADSSRVAATALGLALQTGATLELVYAFPDPLSRDPNGLLDRHLDFEPAAMLDKARSNIEALFDRMVNQIEVPFPEEERAHQLLDNRKVLVGDPPHALVDHADNVDADLIVVGTHNRESHAERRLGRTAHTIACTTPTHVLAVPL